MGKEISKALYHMQRNRRKPCGLFEKIDPVDPSFLFQARRPLKEIKNAKHIQILR